MIYDPIPHADLEGVGANGALSDLDRTVVALSRLDPPGSVHPIHGAGIVAALFGPRPARSLADPRLEELRRYSVIYRAGRGRRDALPPRGFHALTGAEMAAARAIIDGWTVSAAAASTGHAWLVPTGVAAVLVCLVGTRVL